MLQVFHIDVVKVDWDVAYVAMIIHVCCKLLFLMFHLFFKMYVASVFIWILHMFYTYVASGFISMFVYVLQWLLKCFKVFFQVFKMHVSSVSSIFRRILQIFYLDVSKVDWVLYYHSRLLLEHRARVWEADGALHGCKHKKWRGKLGSGAVSPRLARACSSRERPSERAGASAAQTYMACLATTIHDNPREN
jgi:hypothetical protein